ncbi:MAG: LPS export ABC transporter periplasmic protein LptC [Candidatus Eisenbacteria bacterium]|nr:LPS export ABC transporter periplasmic protein LptC [Candidatus Eisenbacteria bacterium]
MTPAIPRHGILPGLALLCLVAACSPESTSPALTRAATRPDEIIEDMKVTETSAGSRSWTLHARRALVYNAQNRVEVEGVDVDFYDEGGKAYSHLTCNRGTLNQSTNDMVAEGRVDIRTTTGVHVESEVLRFWNGQQKITSDAFVRVTDAQGSVLSGVGFESDTKVEHYKIVKVDATLRQAGGKDL